MPPAMVTGGGLQGQRGRGQDERGQEKPSWAALTGTGKGGGRKEGRGSGWEGDLKGCWIELSEVWGIGRWETGGGAMKVWWVELSGMAP